MAKEPDKTDKKPEKKTLDDLVNEINEQKAKSASAPNPNAPVAPVISKDQKQQMLEELAKKFGTTPDEVAKSLAVGDPVPMSAPEEHIDLPPGTKLVDVILKRDFWAPWYARNQWPGPPETGFQGDNRMPAGSGIKLTLEDAKRLIAAGVAERSDPLPGDEPIPDPRSRPGIGLQQQRK